MTAAAASPCPPPDRLLEFASGELGDEQTASLEAHIDSCDECRAALSNAARGDVPPRFGRYRIDTVLGAGGMGIVYRAWDPQLARAVAIKVVKRAADDATGRARLVREAQSLARLSHPNVCHVYDVGTDGDEVWVAMELIDGVSLRDWAITQKDRVLDVLLGAAEGIAAAHAAGMIHRDIKPENVLVTRDGRAIVTDFGLARGGDYIDPSASTLHTDPTLTATGAIAGTPAYLAPEQLTGEALDDRVDQFAWAVMAWELMAGSRPFPAVFALRVDAVRAGVTPPATMDARIATVLTRALQVVPSDRFGSMRELIEALRAPAPRRKWLAAPAFIALGALVAGGAAITVRATVHTAPAVAAASPSPSPTPIPSPPPPPTPTPSTIPIPAPVVTPGAARQVPRSTRPIATPDVITTPDPRVEHVTTPERITTTEIASHVRPLHRSNALASLLMSCRVPSDPAHPPPEWGLAVADWGKVTSVGVEHGELGGDPVDATIVTIAGQRARYRIKKELGVLGDLEVNVGDVVALCADREPTDAEHFRGGPIVPIITALPVHGEPRLGEVVRRHARYVTDIELAAQGVGGRVRLAADGTYFVLTRSNGTHDGGLLAMDRWFLDVPAGMPGADQIASAKPVWLIADKPELVGARFVMHAVEVIPEIFP